MNDMDREIPRKKWKPKRDIPIGLGVLLFSILVFSIAFGDRSSKLNIQSERITISQVTQGPFQEYIPVIGTVIPIRTVYLDVVEGGRVNKIYLRAGTLVNAGEGILKLENTDLLLNSLNREADLAEQSNALRNTRLDMERYRLQMKSTLADLNYEIKSASRAFKQNQTLLEKNLISRENFEASKDNYEYLIQKRELTIESFKQDSIFRAIQINHLEGSLDRMQENLSLIKANLANLTVKAPISGQLTSMTPEIGESIAKGERIGQIDVLDGFKIRVPVDEHYISRINLGQQGKFDFNDKTYHVVIRKIFPEVIEGRFKVDMYFINETPNDIRRGQTLHIRLELGDLTEALLLARGGFYQQTGGQWIFVLTEDEKTAVKRPIKLGRQNSDYFEVLEGLVPYEQVITSSYDNFGKAEKLLLKE